MLTLGKHGSRSLLGIDSMRQQVGQVVEGGRKANLLEDEALEGSPMLPMELVPVRRGIRDYFAVMLFGTRGKGKTLFMSVLARVFDQRYRRAGVRGRRKIFANYWNEDADVCDPFVLDALIDPRYMHLIHDGLLLIDEIQSAATGRRAMSRVNVGLAYYLTQIRKQHLDVVFTTQRPQYIDQQVLTQVNLFVETRMTFERGAPPTLTAFVHDYFGEVVADHMYRERRGLPKPWEADWVRTVWGVEKVFGRYDTDETVVPMYLPADLRRKIVLDEWERKGHTGKLLRSYAELDQVDVREALGYLPNAPAEDPQPAPTDDAAAAIDQYTTGRQQFNVAALVTALRHIDDPPGRADVLAYLEEQGGWSITRRGVQAFAVRT